MKFRNISNYNAYKIIGSNSTSIKGVGLCLVVKTLIVL